MTAKFRLNVGDFFKRLRQIPKLAFDKFQGRLEVRVDEELLAKVLAIFGDSPGEPSSPFVFGSERSTKFWFWLITEYPELTDGSHWIRTSDLENSFQTEVTFGPMVTTITIFSTRPDSKYVYGPWAVQGHINTGWPSKWDQAKALIYAECGNVFVDTWDSAFYEAAKEAGF